MRRSSWTTALLSRSLTLSHARSLTLCPRIDWPFSPSDGDVLQGVAWCGKLVDEWAFGMLAQMHSFSPVSFMCVCACVCYCSNSKCMHMCVCVCACMNTMLFLCCYRMELWPLSCQHSCVAIGPGVRGSSRRLGDNNLPHLLLLSQGVTMPHFGNIYHPDTYALKLAWCGCHTATSTHWSHILQMSTVLCFTIFSLENKVALDSVWIVIFFFSA